MNGSRIRFSEFLSEKQQLAFQYLEDDITTELLYGGASGGGKSVLGCFWQIYRRLKYPGTIGLIGREELARIKDSTLVTFYEVSTMLGMKAEVDYHYNAQDHIIFFPNGSKILLREVKEIPSDPEFQRFGSVPLTDAWLEEGGEISEKAFEIINTRCVYLLEKYGLIPKILTTANPEDNWIKKKWVVPKREGKLLPYQDFISAIVDDNPNKKYVLNKRRQLERMSDPYNRARLLYGDWDVQPRSGREYFPNFNEQIHVEKKEYDPRQPLHISLDFNLNPYITLEVAQIYIKDRKAYVYFIDEMCLAHPHNNTQDVCRRFFQKYHVQLNHRGGLFFYGDPSGATGSTMQMSEDMRHNYDILKKELRPMLNSASSRVMRRAPSLIRRREFVMDMLAEKLRVTMRISPACPNLIGDFRYLKQDANGGKLKNEEKDEVTKQKVNKYSHTSDAAEYMLVRAFPEIFKAYEKMPADKELG